MKHVVIPDLGEMKATVVEILVKPGQIIGRDEPVVVLESDKASMEVVSDDAGVVQSIEVQLGDAVSTGQAVVAIEVDESQSAEPTKSTSVSKSSPSPQKPTAVPSAKPQPPLPTDVGSTVYASPIVRRLSRDLHLDLSRVRATGRGGRITKEDIIEHLKGDAQSAIPALSSGDPAAFGDTELMALSKINKLSAEHLRRCWLNIPHVTQHDDAVITELEAFRQQHKEAYKKKGIPLTPLAFILTALSRVLKQYPRFSSSLAKDGTSLILKKYCHLGVAVNTEDGLVVPVIRDVDQKSIVQLARELKFISTKARTKGLAPKDIQGACMTVSSLGGIGGRYFTPIVNGPQVAILGVSKAFNVPVRDGDQLKWELQLPLSLSYDHRVIDGAQGAEFLVVLVREIEKISRDLGSNAYDLGGEDE